MASNNLSWRNNDFNKSTEKSKTSFYNKDSKYKKKSNEFGRYKKEEKLDINLLESGKYISPSLRKKLMDEKNRMEDRKKNNYNNKNNYNRNHFKKEKEKWKSMKNDKKEVKTFEYNNNNDDFPSLSNEKKPVTSSVWNNKDKLTKVCTGEFKKEKKENKIKFKKNEEVSYTNDGWSSLEEDYESDYYEDEY